MDTKDEVRAFLEGFKQKIDIHPEGVIYLHRDKNFQTLADLDIRPIDRTACLKNLRVEDYYRGPTIDNEARSDYWEFGIVVKGQEVYVKIRMGNVGKPVICISFHLAERTITYPFKSQ